MKIRHLAVLAMAAWLPVATAGLAQQDVVREITRIEGDLYRFRNNFHFSVFLITSQGAICTDPIDAEAAAWLKEQLATRFGTSCRYLVYSHDHRDHIAGGEVLGEEAVIVAQANAKATILGEKRPTAVPQVTFAEAMEIELGGKRVELRYLGRNHSDNSIVMRFPEEGVLFAVDFIPVRAVAFRDLPDAWIPDWIDSLKRVEAMDFRILVPGHGPLGTRADVTAFRQYMEDLHAAVLAEVRAGTPLEDAKTKIRLDRYADWSRYEDWLPLNIEGMYRRIQLHRRPN